MCREGEKQMMRFIAMTTVLSIALLVTTVAGGLAQEVPRMTVDSLRDRLSEAKLVVIDVRTGRDWSGSERMIKGATREEPGKIDWAGKYNPEQTLVFYCT